MGRSRGRGAVAGVVVSLIATLALGSSAHAANIPVTNLGGDNSVGSLHAAMVAANANPGDKDTITFDAGLSGVVELTDDLPVLTGPVAITGPGSDKVTIDGFVVVNERMFQTDKDLTLTGLSLRKGANDNGGAISSTGADLVVKDVAVTESHSYTGKGGAVYVDGGTLTLENSTIFDNVAVAGAGLWIHGTSSASISNTQIVGNDAKYFFDPGPDPQPNTGGGLLVDDSDSLVIKESVIRANSAVSDGFAFSIDNVRNVTISDTFVSQNNAEFVDFPEGYDYFGTARIIADQTNITDSQFTDNYSPSMLAGLQVIGPVTISRSLISGNTSAGLYSGLTLGPELSQTFPPPNNVTATVSNTTITANEGGNFGTGLISFNSRLNLDSSTITGNSLLFPVYPTASSAGILQMNGTATLTNSIVSGNGATDITAISKIPQSPVPNQDFGGYVEGSYNLIGTVTGRPFKDLVAGSNIISHDPKLGPLGYSSGAKTQTMVPAPDSPVIDAGKSSLTTDQNGLPRPVAFGWLPTPSGGNRADIGAVEVQSLTAPKNRFTIGKVKTNRKKGTATIKVKVPWSGKIQLRGSKTVKPFNRSAAKAATVTLTVKAKGKAAKSLKKKGQTKVKATITFTTAGMKPLTKSKTVKLKGKKRQ